MGALIHFFLTNRHAAIFVGHLGDIDRRHERSLAGSLEFRAQTQFFFLFQLRFVDHFLAVAWITNAAA